MAYRLKKSGAVGGECRRIAEEQIDRAVEEIDDEELDRRGAVHQVRKRCKKIRALLRLGRGPLDEHDAFDRENAWYRDIAAGLSGVRDAEVLVETHDALVEPIRDLDIRTECVAIRDRLVARHRQLAEEEGRPEERLSAARAALLEGRERVPQWARRVRGFQGMDRGLKRTYQRGRRAMNTAYKELSDEAFHEWRKRVKYHWYACRLLREIWPAEMDARRGEASRLAGLLGGEHDLGVYRATLDSRPDWLGGILRLTDILGAVDQRRTGLRRDAYPLGMRLYSEKPGGLSARFAGYWRAWRSERE